MLLYLDKTEELYVESALKEARELAKRRTNLADGAKEVERSKEVEKIYERILKKFELNK